MMTAHSSKGLEFDYVFMPFAVEESWMPRARSSYFIMPNGKGEGDEIKDSRRLFYVGLTRAKKHAVILSPLEDGPRKLSPLRFIDELGENVSKINVPPASVLFEKKKESLSNRRQQELLDYAKSIILEKGLSVTALNHFCGCPSHFFYKSILKLPEPPSASAEKGNAMHLAISRVWALEDRGEKQIEATLELTIEEYFEKSLLPAFEKKAVLKELLEDVKDVSRALAPHFAQQGEASPEIWMETSLDVSYEGKSISVRLHGKLDAVVLGADKASVFDYKTRTAMSPAAIKGETKGSTGDYFRQLIFYKLLLQSNGLYKGKVIEPSLVFVKPDDKGRCPTITLPVEQTDVERVKGEVQKLVESVWSGDLIKEVCEDDACEWCRWKKTTGWRE
jgi:DNA helicase-2/ATP-dependent DNA helicase PcrA